MSKNSDVDIDFFEENLEENLIKICRSSDINVEDLVNLKNISLTEEIPIVYEDDALSNSINTFKAALMLTIEELQSTIDFLKNEHIELRSIIDFFKNEFEEKNLHIRTLLFSDANEGRKIGFDFM